MALSTAVKEVIWIQRTINELARTLDDEKIIYEDNQGAIALGKNPEHHARTKHIDTVYHFIRECINSNYNTSPQQAWLPMQLPRPSQGTGIES
jgi:hypothetical protein